LVLIDGDRTPKVVRINLDDDYSALCGSELIPSAFYWRFSMPQSVSAPTQRVVLSGINWATYQALIRDLEAQPRNRLTYDHGTLEIMVPLPPHERYKTLISRLIEVVTEETETEICSLGSSTWTREDLQQGVEADACYYIQHERAVRSKNVIDLTTDPPPDLVVEIDITSSSLHRLAIYAALGVPEVWCYDGNTLIFYRLHGQEYSRQEQSAVLPLIQRDAIARFLATSQTMGETSLIREFRQWVRTLLPQ
jgi:Uma2 family endonuclease